MRMGKWARTFWRFEWKPQDAWVGVFWKVTKLTDEPDAQMESLDVWVCVLPMVPLQVQFWRGFVKF